MYRNRYAITDIDEGHVCKEFPQLDITFSSVHKLKGQECDYGIIIGLENGRLGFPSGIEEDVAETLLLPEEDRFPYAEERRLFYVAMTRCKHQVFLLCSSRNTSAFVEEILSSDMVLPDGTITVVPAD